jgi:hypothetical protein
MRTSRLLGEVRSFYHVMARVVDRRIVFKARIKNLRDRQSVRFSRRELRI